jgi:thiol-disulfide isomerase/thioredoxin
MLRRCALAALALVVLISCSSSSGARPGRPIDADFKRFDGTAGNFKEFRGRPVLVNFFSSTCPPCITEMPALEQAHLQLGDQVVFLGIDVNDTVEGGRAFIASTGITWELGRDPDLSLLQGVMGGVALPTTVILDAEGRIAYSHLGRLDEPGEVTQILRDHHLIP